VFFTDTGKKEQEHQERSFVKECLQHAGLRHPNIVQLMGIYWPQGQPTPTMVLELLHTSLSGFLDNHTDVPLPFKHRILLDISTGLRFLHERAPPILHRDLTANNVLLTEDMRAKISDLGMARILPNNCQESLTKVPGNQYYMPPEADTEVTGNYNSKLDIFSFGALIIHTVLHKFPSTSKPATFVDSKKGLMAITEVERREHLYSKMDANDRLTSLSKECLHNDPECRPTAQKIYVTLAGLMSKSCSFFMSSLEYFNKLRSVQEKKEKMTEHFQNAELQVQKTLENLSRNGIRSERDKKDLVEQLQSVLHDMQSGLQQKVDSCRPAQLVVSVSPTLLEAAQSSSANQAQADLLQISSVSLTTPHPISLIVCRSLSHTFTGTYVKTVLSGLTKCLGVAVREGLLYVVDHNGWKGVHICNLDTGEVESVIDSSTSYQSASEERCWGPGGIALDKEGNIILADNCNHRVAKYTREGIFVCTSGPPNVCGKEKGEFNKPLGVCVTSGGEILVCDVENHRLQVLNSSLKCQRVFGKHGRGNCEFYFPRDVAVDSKGNIHVVDCSNYCVKVFSPDFNFLRKFGKEGNDLGDFRYASSLCIDERDYVYVTDRI